MSHVRLMRGRRGVWIRLLHPIRIKPRRELCRREDAHTRAGLFMRLRNDRATLVCKRDEVALGIGYEHVKRFVEFSRSLFEPRDQLVETASFARRDEHGARMESHDFARVVLV